MWRWNGWTRDANCHIKKSTRIKHPFISWNCHETLGNTCSALRYFEWLIKQWLLLNYAFMWYELFNPANSSYQTWPHPVIFKYFPSTEGHLCTLSNTYYMCHDWSWSLVVCPLVRAVKGFLKETPSGGSRGGAPYF